MKSRRTYFRLALLMIASAVLLLSLGVLYSQNKPTPTPQPGEDKTPPTDATEKKPEAKLFLWRVTSTSGKEAWIFAGVPMDKSRLDGLDKAVDEAFNSAGAVIASGAPDFPTEADLGAIKPRAELKDQKLNDLISTRVKELITQAAKEHNLKPEDLNFKAWYVGLWMRALYRKQALSSTMVEPATYFADRGRESNKKFVDLSGTDDLLKTLDALPQGLQNDFLRRELLAGKNAPAELRNVIKAWNEGNAFALESRVHRVMKADAGLKAVHDAVEAPRNRALADRLATLIEEESSPFIVLDAADVVGPAALPALLAAKGFKLERVAAGSDAGPDTLVTGCQTTYAPDKDFKMEALWEHRLEAPQRTARGVNWAAYKDVIQSGKWRKIPVPGIWSDNPRLNKAVDQLKGIRVWYRCNIILSGKAPPNRALYFGTLEDADEVYFNDKLIGRTGSVEPTRVDIEKPRLYGIPNNLWRQNNLVVVGLYGSRDASGFPEPPRIVDEIETARALSMADTPAIVFSWIYVLISTFFALFWLFFRHQWENLFFALFSAGLGFYHLIRTSMRYELFETFEGSYKTELLILIVLPVLFTFFVTHLIKIKTPRIVWFLTGFYGLVFMAGLLSETPPEWYNVIYANLAGLLAFVLVVLWIIRDHYASNRHKLRYILLGLIPLVPALINDMLVTMRFINTPRIMVFAFLLFLGFVALQLADSVLELYRDLQNQEQELRQLEKRKTSSIFNISTEFRLIFDRLKEGARLLEETGFNGATKAKITKARSAMRRPILNLQNFLDDSQLLPLLESGDYAVRRIRFGVRKLVEDVLSRVEASTGESLKRVIADLPEENEEIWGDPDLLSTALYHLLENALLYTEGKVELSVESDPSRLSMVVRDEGPGMDGVQQNLFFQKFVRGVDDLSDIPGIGVGLTIVNLIARTVDGSLRLESGGGYFSTFMLHVPLIQEQRA